MGDDENEKLAGYFRWGGACFESCHASLVSAVSEIQGRGARAACPYTSPGDLTLQ